MKILICYFSGTGNTKKVVDRFAEELSSKGASVATYDISDGEKFDASDDFDILGIAYPVHAFNAPANILSFARVLKQKFKNREGKIKYFIIKTSGEPLGLNNISSLKMKSILKKNFEFLSEFHYCMPYNIIFRHTDNMAFKMWDIAQKVIPIDCEEVLSMHKHKLPYVFCGRFLAWLFRIEHWGGRFNGKRYKVNENCIKCGLCIKRCPTNNIKIEDGHFVFGDNCLMCMRCSFFCPANAIKIGLFEKWKVNGAYNFANFNENEKATHEKYCKKSYKKYFDRMEKKLQSKTDE